MKIIFIDVLDGNRPIQVIVNDAEELRLMNFLDEARTAIKELEEVDDPRENGWVDQYGRP